MTLNCQSCGRAFDAKRSAAKFCGDTCRKRAQRAPQSSAPASSSTPPAATSGLAEVTERTLLEAGVLDTIAGQQAITLARRIESPAETGAAVSAMSKQLQAVVVDAMKSVKSADPLDELRRRRDHKRAAG